MRHEVFSKFDCWKGYVEPGFLVNFLGVLTRSSFADWNDLGGQIVAPEFPALNEEYLEWIDMLEAVTAARGDFTMIELGAGWGRWVVNAAAAVEQYSGIPYRLIAVEAEPKHFQLIEVHIRDNRVDPKGFQLIQAAVADKDGKVWLRGNSSEWGQSIAFGQSIASVLLSRLRGLFGIAQDDDSSPWRLKKVRAESLNTLLRPLDKVDLIDLDVQGAELTVLKPAAKQLDQKVRRVHIGTHGPEIESGLRNLFRGLGWDSVNDYPCNSECHTPWGSINFQDGVQSWINPGLK